EHQRRRSRREYQIDRPAVAPFYEHHDDRADQNAFEDREADAHRPKRRRISVGDLCRKPQNRRQKTYGKKKRRPEYRERPDPRPVDKKECRYDQREREKNKKYLVNKIPRNENHSRRHGQECRRRKSSGFA